MYAQPRYFWRGVFFLRGAGGVIEKAEHHASSKESLEGMASDDLYGHRLIAVEINYVERLLNGEMVPASEPKEAK